MVDKVGDVEMEAPEEAAGGGEDVLGSRPPAIFKKASAYARNMTLHRLLVAEVAVDSQKLRRQAFAGRGRLAADGRFLCPGAPCWWSQRASDRKVDRPARHGVCHGLAIRFAVHGARQR
jgi:hypothetical protein